MQRDGLPVASMPFSIAKSICFGLPFQEHRQSTACHCSQLAIHAPEFAQNDNSNGWGFCNYGWFNECDLRLMRERNSRLCRAHSCVGRLGVKFLNFSWN
jgi:hypothetical protein